MKSYGKLVVIIVIAIVLTIIINIFTLLSLSNSINDLKLKHFQESNFTQNKIDTDENNISNELLNTIEEKNTTKDATLEIADENDILNYENTEKTDTSIGKIIIPKIDFEGKIYEGTSLEVLAEGVGHFDNSPYLDGNVCLAAHNTSKFWAKLNSLKKGDKISYESFLGTREYVVSELSQIEETDWTKLENTDENMLTLITCVKGNKPMRLCVKAKAV